MVTLYIYEENTAEATGCSGEMVSLREIAIEDFIVPPIPFSVLGNGDDDRGQDGFFVDVVFAVNEDGKLKVSVSR